MRTHPLVAAVVVVGFALFVLWRVRVDYSTRGRLTMVTVVLQFLMFLVHALASYSFLDSRFSAVSTGHPLFAPAVTLMATGLAATLVGMSRLGWGDTVGRSVTGLRRSGLYRFSRNPQLVSYLLFLAGYALLWPSWLGLAWLGLYCAVAQLMVLTEEAHLRRAFGAAYEGYTRSTPRYIGIPPRQR